MPDRQRRPEPQEYEAPQPVGEPLITDRVDALVTWTCSKVATILENIDEMQDRIDGRR